MLIIQTEEQFDREVLKSDKPVLVDFYADWCGPCKAFAPLLEEMDEEAKNYLIAKVNVDELEALAQRYRVVSIPTVIVFKNGESTARSSGVQKRSELEKML